MDISNESFWKYFMRVDIEDRQIIICLNEDVALLELQWISIKIIVNQN